MSARRPSLTRTSAQIPTGTGHKRKLWNTTLIRILNDHDLRRFLINNRDFLLVEDTSNELWASGRSHYGRNTLGKIMNKFGQTANSEYDLKKKLELTAFLIEYKIEGAKTYIYSQTHQLVPDIKGQGIYKFRIAKFKTFLRLFKTSMSQI